MGGIGKGGRGWKVGETKAGMERTTARNEKEDFQIVRVAQCDLNGLRKGGGAFGQLFFEPSPV